MEINKEVIDKCFECARIKKCIESDGVEVNVCSVFQNPSVKWRMSVCPMATNIKSDKVAVKKVNPIKQSKRRRK